MRPWAGVGRALGWFAALGLARMYFESLPAPTGPAAEPETLALLLVRLLAQAVWWYLVAVTAVTSLAHVLGLVRGRRVRSLPLPGGASILRVLTGLGLGLSAVASAEPVSAQPSPPILQREPIDVPPSPPPPEPVPPPPAEHPATHTVVAGESFWSIAEGEVARRLGRPPTDPDVAPYWLRLIDANRDRLVDPAEPDLLHPGQTLLLPPPP
jgi:hypothetical protein